MRILLTILLLVHSITGFQPPTIDVEGHTVQVHASIGKFVELSQHDRLVLICSGRFDQLEYNFLNLDDNAGYSKSSFDDRVEETIDDAYGDTILTISDLRESDTGTYSCSSKEHSSLNDTLHVFVHNSKLFVPLKYEVKVYNQGEVMVPCKTTQFVDNSEIELYADNSVIKAASKNYDQRYGFKITKKIYDMKPFHDVKFKCKSKKDTSQAVEFIISEREAKPDQHLNFFKFDWDKGMEWPYVGLNFTLTCHLDYVGPSGKFEPYLHQLHASCPKCSTDSGSHAVAHKHRIHGNRISATINIASLTLEDAGNYSCVWKYEENKTSAPTVIEKQINVAPNRAQIKIIERSPRILRAKEGNPTSLFAKFAIYPSDENSYVAKWSRMYNSSIKDGIQSEILINDELRTISAEDLTNGVFSETLDINRFGMTANMSGTYVLSISHDDTIQVVQWEMAIENSKPDVKIAVREPSSFIVFNQQFYPPDTHLHIDCVSISIPPADVTLEQRKDKNSEFNPIDPSQLERIEGTFESGLIWNLTLNSDIELRCSSERNEEVFETRKTLKVAEGAPKAYSKIEKSSKATESEDTKQIFEGDTVKLICVVPRGASDWDVFWRLDNNDLEAETEIEGLSKNVILTLNDVATDSSGKYTCVVKSNDFEKHLEHSLHVERTTKPYHTEGDSMSSVEVDYDGNFTLDCNMAGIPPPEYTWYKDGNPYQHGDTEGSLLKVSRARAEDRGKFHCLATNRAGSTDNYINVRVNNAPESSKFHFWLMGFFFIICIVTLIFCARKILIEKKRSKQKDIALRNLYHTLMSHEAGPLPDDIKDLPIEERTYYLKYNTDFEIARENLEILETLGSGQFGIVKKGLLSMADPKSQMEYKTRLPVAVKSCARQFDIEQQKMLAAELKVMCSISTHPNVLALIGAVTTNMRKGELLIVTEFMDAGNLRDYLRKNASIFKNELIEDSQEVVDDSYMVPNSVKKKKYQFDDAANGEHDSLLRNTAGTLCTSDLLSISLQIANGMEWLASVPCVHRDLACRNVLLTKNKMVRIADFGLAKKHDNNSYYKTKSKDAMIPVRWLPLESIESQKYTQKSDVWSFGICLYEIFTLGGLPYPNVPNNMDISEYVKSGKRNAQPEYCHDEVYELMKICWHEKPDARPTFTDCVDFFKGHLGKSTDNLLERIDNMLHFEQEEQMKLGEWVQKSRPDITGNNFKKPAKKVSEERYLIVESHA